MDYQRARIKEAALEFILNASRSIYPNEFTGLLRGEDNLMEEVLVIPKSTYGRGFATTQWDMVPIDSSIIGSVHSHPGPKSEPSKQDLRYFRKVGWIHLIVKKPYRSLGDVSGYTSNGELVELIVE